MSVSLVIRQLAWVPSLSLRHIRHASFFLQKILVLLSYCHVSEAAWSCSMCPWDYLSYRKPAFPQTHFMHAHECADSSPLSYIHWRECWLAHTRSCIYSYHLADGTMKKTNKKEDAKQLFVATSSLRAFGCVCVCVLCEHAVFVHERQQPWAFFPCNLQFHPRHPDRPGPYLVAASLCDIFVWFLCLCVCCAILGSIAMPARNVAWLCFIAGLAGTHSS